MGFNNWRFTFSWYWEIKKWRNCTFYYFCYELVYGCTSGFGVEVYGEGVEGEGCC